MTAIDIIENISNNNYLLSANLKYCLVKKDKHPYTIKDTLAKPNNVDDFVEFKELLQNKHLDEYAGIGISIQASNICAIDVDKCFSKPFNLSTADYRAKDIIKRFDKLAYIEFSFSGKGLRVLFKQPLIENYSEKYYIKNDKMQIEYYQPSKSYRYVTLTGITIANNPIITKISFMKDIYDFLDEYMLRPQRNLEINILDDNKTIEELMNDVKKLYFKNTLFQNAWFDTEHKLDSLGQSLESQNDFKLLSILFEHITQNKDKLRNIFEKSPYYQTKDKRHINKWLYGNYRYYNYVYKHLGGKK